MVPVGGSGAGSAWPWSSAPPSQRLAPPLPRVPLGLGPVQAPERRSPAFGISDLIPALALPCQGDLGSVGSQGGGVSVLIHDVGVIVGGSVN